MKCRNCVNFKSEWCEKVNDSPDPDLERDCQYFKQKTNADRIRAMTDEELAEFLESTHSNMAIKLGGEYIVRAKEYIGIWLQQPVKEGAE